MTEVEFASTVCIAGMGEDKLYKLKHSFAVINCGHNGPLFWTLVAQQTA